jgi:hypothetical protein
MLLALILTHKGMVNGLCNLDILNSNTCVAIILLVMVFLSCSTDHWEMSIFSHVPMALPEGVRKEMEEVIKACQIS